MSDKFKWLPDDGNDERYVNDRTGEVVAEIFEEMSGDWAVFVFDASRGTFVSKRKAKLAVEREIPRGG